MRLPFRHESWNLPILLGPRTYPLIGVELAKNTRSEQVMFSKYITAVKSGWLDLNQRLHAPKAWLLAAELHPVDTPGGS